MISTQVDDEDDADPAPAVIADPAAVTTIRDALDAAGFSVDGADRVWVPEGGIDEDKLFEVAVDAGADDVVDDAVFADPALSASIRDALDAAGFVVEASDRIWVPEDRVDAPAPHAALDALDALDDVSAVWHNAQ